MNDDVFNGINLNKQVSDKWPVERFKEYIYRENPVTALRWWDLKEKKIKLHMELRRKERNK